MLLKTKLAEHRPANKSANEFLMAAFYASIGLGCRYQDFFSVGPCVLLLMSVTLITHLVILLGGSWLYNQLPFVPMQYKIDIDTPIIASNACIGGCLNSSIYGFIVERE